MNNWNEIFDYNSETGMLRWKIRPCRHVRPGGIAGCNNGDGYLRVQYRGKLHLVHRVICEMIHGSIPPGMQVDHINRIRTDNRIVNFRLATSSENHRNRSLHSNNTSGFVGVTWDKTTGKWLAYLKVSNKFRNLGRFTNKSAAIAARLAGEALHHGEFAQSLVKQAAHSARNKRRRIKRLTAKRLALIDAANAHMAAMAATIH